MALRELIKDQTIMIDDHRRGSQEVKNWDDPSQDVHIDKTTNFPIKGRIQKVRIKIPINSDRPIKIQNERKGEIEGIPRRLLKEINKALEDCSIRNNFIEEILTVLKDFKSALSSEERANSVLTRISKHFGLEWPKEKIKKYVNDVLSSYTLVYEEDGKEYFSKINNNTIEIGQNNGYAKKMMKVNRS